MGGSFDLWGSRRINFEYCEWYERDEKATKDLSKLVYNKAPSAVFYAKETSSESRQKQELGGLFLGDESTIQIVTQDDVEGIKGGDLVKFRGQMWHVTGTQSTEVHKQGQFLDKTTKTTYIGLRR